MYKRLILVAIIVSMGFVSSLILSQVNYSDDLPPTPTPYQTETCEEHFTPFCDPLPEPTYNCSSDYATMTYPWCQDEIADPTPTLEVLNRDSSGFGGHVPVYTQATVNRDYSAFLARIQAIFAAYATPEYEGGVWAAE